MTLGDYRVFRRTTAIVIVANALIRLFLLFALRIELTIVPRVSSYYARLCIYPIRKEENHQC